MANILIADDEKEIVRLIKIYISSEENKIFEAYDGDRAIEILKNKKIDLALIDIMMPKKNGYEIISYIRKNSNIPILVISAKVALSDRVFGIDLGADDYITKPFEALELAAKVRRHLRRREKEEKIDTIKVNKLLLDLNQCTVYVKGERKDLTRAEYKVLELFMKNPKRIFTKDQIYEYGWDDKNAVDDNTIRVIISRLREKIGSKSIKTIRGLGYRLELEDE